MYKKPIFFLLVLGLLCPLAGCAPAESEVQATPAPAAVSGPAQPTEQPLSGSESAPDSHLVFSRSTGAQTADGFYTIHTYDDWTGCLVFYDYASHQAVPVCAQPNCEHHDETCPAWFGTDIPRIVTNGEQLVFCYLNAPARLETAAPDGSNRKVLYEFSANETPGDGFCVDENAVYLLTTRVESGQENSQNLLRIGLEDGSCETLWSSSTTGGSYAFLTGCRDHFLVLKEIRRNTQAADTPEQLADQTHTLLLADPRDGGTTPLYEWQQGEALESPLAEDLFCITADHRLCAFAGENQLTPLAQDERFTPSVTVVQYADDTALWFTAPEEGTKGNTRLYQLDLGSGAITPVPLSDGKSVTVLGEYDGKLFVRLAEDDSLQASLDTRYALVSPDRLTGEDGQAALEEFTELF